MPNYTRRKVAGATVFFTVNLAQRQGRLLVDEIDVLREAVAYTRARRPFGIEAWVVLPDHMHAIWTLPEDDSNYSDRWGAIKARFSKRVREEQGGAVGYKPTLRRGNDVERLRASRSASKVAKQDAGIWQRRFWEHHIRGKADLEAHLRYCWLNPVKHGLVADPFDWPYSSIHRDHQMGRVEHLETP
ncbi:REP-associated tyrosine transposase [Pseudoprimorskyibacter insulae]|uniref:REP-associated tyrosine transposase n=1 Tax=Pseudoprimorskyibacter insulae TaxID=1695997 RepID=UPI000D54CFBD|nr:transposase [Pseudoprimorskyibacter insulae]